ncbi:Npun_F0296 family exosortase-dependent surface protein [Haloferula sargassicola]|uniref:PEP-CTERM protein-sorting domain-containing protein n=1 Tax=Haloferula sargassicola TaxID=490096 RepID=A0ABP9UM40_9BACT
MSSDLLMSLRPTAFRSWLVLALGLAGATSSQAALIITYAESPGEMQTTLTSTQVFTFNSLPGNSRQSNVSWAGVGTINQVYVRSADQYGGATLDGLTTGTNTNYAVQSTSVGGGSATSSTTLTFAAEQAYFGLWWSAGDPNNQLQFYKNSVLVAQYSTLTLLDAVAADAGYKGNPTTAFVGKNAGEGYAFVNFFGLEGTTWDTIVFTNTANTGFESDNWTTRFEAYGTLPGEDPDELPGKEVAKVTGTRVETLPEPTAVVFAGLGGLLALVRRRRAV